MKRGFGFLCIVLSLLMSVSSLTVAAQGSLTYVTDYEYASLKTGGKEDRLVYTVYAAGGKYQMGTLDETGELTRESYSLVGWQEMLEPEIFTVTVTGDGGELCPYAATHTDHTVCPYLTVLRVTLTDNQTGNKLQNYYIEGDETVVLPDGAVHFCFGRYGYEAPVTIKWDGENRYMALRNAEGMWGAYDIETRMMATDYLYKDMSAVYGDYAKVYNGEAWGRLDLSGTYETGYCYAEEDDFNVTEDVRQLDDGTWQVFSKDNESISVVFDGEWEEVSYEAGSHLLMTTDSLGNKTMYDIMGNVVATFDKTQIVRHLQDACYAVEKMNSDDTLFGIALVRADDIIKPEDTVEKYDVNFDGSVDSSDMRLIVRHAAGSLSLTERQQIAADLDENGEVTSVDARLLMLSLLQ